VEIRSWNSRTAGPEDAWVDIQLEAGLKRAIEWISRRRQEEPAARLATLVEDACQRYDLSPLQADFLFRHFTQG
jgi:hypothetical protein